MKINYNVNKIRPGIAFLIQDEKALEKAYNLISKHSTSKDEMELSVVKRNLSSHKKITLIYRLKSDQLGNRIIGWYESESSAKRDGYKFLEI